MDKNFEYSVINKIVKIVIQGKQQFSTACCFLCIKYALGCTCSVSCPCIILSSGLFSLTQCLYLIRFLYAGIFLCGVDGSRSALVSEIFVLLSML